MKTSRAPRGRLGHVARWAAAVVVAVAGTLLASASDAWADTAYYRSESCSSGNWEWDTSPRPWWFGGREHKCPDDGGANDVHFNNNTHTNMTLNGRWFSVGYLEFESDASQTRTIGKSGNAGINLKYGLKNLASVEHVFNAPISFDDNAQTVWADNGNLKFTDSLYLNQDVTLDAASGKTITISGVIANNVGKLSKSSRTGTVVLSGANTFTNAVTVTGGVLRVSNNSALGSGAGMTTIQSGGQLELTGGITVGERILFKGVGPSSAGAILSSSGNNTLSGLVYNQSTAGSILASSGSTLNLTGTFSNTTVSTTFGGAGNITIASWKTQTNTPVAYKTGSGTLTLTTITKKGPRQGLELQGGTLALTSAGTVTNLALTNSTAGTTIDLSGAVQVGVMNIKKSTTIKVDVATTGQSVSESLTTMNSGGWAISSDFTLKLTPGASFNSANSATWTILGTQGSFDDTDLGHVKPDTTAFAGLATNCFVKSISGKTIVVTYKPAAVAPTMTDAGASSISSSGATVSGSGLNAGGASTTVTFGYGTEDGSYTNSATVTGSPFAGGTTSGAPTVTLAGLDPGTEYFYKWTLSNSAGNNEYEGSFTTLKGAQTVTFDPASYSVKMGGTVTVSASGTHESPTIEYYSDTPSVATVNRTTGAITPVAAGAATIRAEAGATTHYAAGSATCTVTVRAAAPTTQATMALKSNFTTTATEFRLGFKRGNGDGLLILAREGDEPTDPADGTKATKAERPTTGTPAWSSFSFYPGSATDKVLIFTNAPSGTNRYVSGATPATHYFLRAYEFKYKTSEGAVNAATADYFTYLTPGGGLDFWTLATEPSGGPTLVEPTEAAGTLGSGSATINWSKGTGGNYTLVVLYGPADSQAEALALAETTPTDGQVYSGSALGGTVLHAGTGTSAPASGLTKEKWYKAVGYSYALGEDNSTANYNLTSHAVTFETLPSNGPEVWATGVDATGFLLNWTNTVAAATGYDVQTKASGGAYADRLRMVFTNSFSSAEGWSDQSGTGANDVTVAGRVWSWKGGSGNNFRLYSTGTLISGDTGQVRFQENGQYVDTPVLYGPISCVKIRWKAGAANQSLQLSKMTGASYGTKTVLTSWTRSSATQTETYSFTPVTGAVRLRIEALSGVPNYNSPMDVAWIEIYGPQLGYSDQHTGLTDGTTYETHVRNNPSGDWSDTLTVKAGVVPTGLATGAVTRSTAAFSWSGAGSPTGYRWMATTNAAGDIVTAEAAGETAGHAWPRVCDTTNASGASILTTNGDFSAKGWRYWGTSCAKDGGGAFNRAAPAYQDAVVSSTHYKGHFLVGDTVMGIESTDFPIAGAATLKFSYTICAWNLNSVRATLENGRVNAYYRLDGGPWSFLGSGVPSGTTDGNSTQQTWTLEKGMLDGTNIAFRLELPHGTVGYFTSDTAANQRMAGVYVQALKVYCTAKGKGDYSEVFAEGTDSGSATVTGLDANCPVYFRVQALQGASVRSVWVETESATSGFPGPDLLEPNPVGRYGFTANWEAEESATGGYQIEWTRCGGSGAGDTTVSTCDNGTLATSGDGVWRYLRPDGSTWPKWIGEGASSVPGHNMKLAVASPSQNPAVASPDMDLSGYSGGYVQFSHWSRHNTYYAPDARVTLWYRTSANGSSWGAWTAGDTTADLTSSTTIVTERLPLPAGAVGSGKTHVQIKLSADHSLESEGGSGTPGNGDASVLTGPVIKDISVHGTTAGTPDYATCAEGMSGIQNVAAGTTLKAFAGLAADTTYYYHVRSVTAGPAYSDWSEGMVTTLAPQEPPAWIRGEDLKQTQMTLEWAESEDAVGYQWELTKCGGTAWSRTVLAATPTNRNLTDGDSWHYIGGGTPVAAVAGVKDSEATYITAAGATYPAWADGGSTKENSLVLAGEGEPGIESEEFSTVGAQEGTLSFRFGRWYAGTEELGAEHTPLTVSYSLDGGASWAQWFMTENAYEYEYTRPVTGKKYGVVSNALPSALLGQPSVMLRIVAESAGISMLDSTNHARGAAIAEAQLQLGGRPGSYDNGDDWTSTPSGTCTLASGTTGADGLTGHVTGLATNTEYYFRVRATDGTQYGAWTDGKASTLNGPATPDAPWAVDIGRHTMTIQWLAADRAETYTLEVYTNSTLGALQTRITGIEGTSQVVTGLKAETTYWFKVRAHADGTDSAWSATASAKTIDTVAVTGLRVEDILETSMTVKWDYVAGTTYTLYWGTAVTEGATDSREEVIECPAKTLERSDAGNKWFYLGGNGTYPAYWTSSGNPTNDQGHALIQNSGGQPGIQSRWFSTFGATNATVEFLHGRFNSGADSSVTVSYSIDGGVSWATAGTAPSTAATNPSVARAIALPASALGRRSVAVRLTADKASGTLGAHLKDVKVVVRTGSTGTGTQVNNASLGNTGSWTVTPGPLAAGTRYWFRLVAAEAGDTAEAVTTAATRTKTTGVVKSQGFEGNAGGALDTTAWAYTTNFYTVGSKVSKSWAAGDPTVTVAKDENPLYGDRAIRLSGSSAAGVYGVVEFANFTTTAGSSLTVTVPFAARNLASGENLWLSYSTDGGTSWLAPAGTTVRTNVSGANGWLMGKIATGGSDVINQNWPYNHGSNTLTRPQGDAYVFTVEGVSQLAVRIAFCGNRGSADHYYYIDEVKLTRNPGDPSGVSATAQDSGGILLGWTPPAGENQGVVILRGRDERHIPASPIDLANLPHGYEIVTNATGGAFWPNTTSPGSCLDMNAISGWRYFYYFYGAISTGDGIMLRPTPKTANAMVKGMVDAIASMGWDGWDIHPWPYKKGRVTNPNTDNVQFVDPSQNGGKPTWETGSQYTSRYGSTNQLDVYGRTNYYGTNSFRLSGGSLVAGVNSNNPAIQFESIDLSGYKNVEFSLHFAGNVIEGGDDMHVAISTNGGTEWLQVSRTNDAGWRVVRKNTYGVVVGDSSPVNNGHWDFYFEDFVKKSYTTWDGQTGWAVPTPEGNPYWLQVPDSVTQFMARVMYFDSQGGNRYDSSYFIDEVRLFGEAALQTPHPRMENIASNRFVVAWDAVPDATSYDVRVTKCAAAGDDAVKLQQAFVLSVVTNGWTTTGSATLGTNFNRTGTGYGLRMYANGTTLTSPEVGAARQVTFWGKAVGVNANSKLLVQVSQDGTAWETLTNYAAQATSSATAIGTNAWVQKTVDLPHRQWQQVRFLMSRSGATGDFYVDDIQILGGGDYDGSGCLVREYQGVSGTSQGFTNGLDSVSLTPGTPYYVEVRANGTPGGYLTHSPWGETGDYTGSDFHATPDGFEMVRLTWAAPNGGILVMAVPETNDYSDVTAPTNTSVGGINGKGVVIQNVNAAMTGAGFEHVRPYGARTEDFDAKYVVYWKRGSYWEGRLETNVVLGTYVAQAAEAFAYTNGISMSATGKQSYLGSGKGWADNWYVTTKPATWDAGSTTRNDSGREGLLETNQLWGAGGNMIALYPGGSQGTQKAYLKRELKTALPAGTEFWGMFTMRITRNGAIDRAWAGMKLLDADGNAVAVIGKLYREDGQKYVGIMNADGSKRSDSYTIGAQTNTYIFKYDGNNMYLRVVPWVSTSDPQWATTASAPSGAQWNAVNGLSMGSLAAIKYVTIEAENCTSEYDVWLGDVYFDEIRLGGTWEELVGKQTEPPQNVTAAQAWADGNELVRIAWQYAGGLTNGTVINPLADGVKIYAKEGAGEGEWVEIYKGTGTNAAVDRNVWSRWDHVVAPGSTHEYKVVAYASSKYTNGVVAVNRDAPETTTVRTGLYGEKEFLDTMSYTNNVGWTTATWYGGNGFSNNWWHVPDGAWTNVNPETAHAALHITNAVPGSRLPVGNVLMASVTNGATASINRTLGGNPWCGTAGETFYVAFRMGYQWSGKGKEAGLRLTDAGGSHIQIGKGYANDDDESGRKYWSVFGVTATPFAGGAESTGWMETSPGNPVQGSMSPFGGTGQATNAYLVVAKVYWLAKDGDNSGKVSVKAWKYQIGVDSLPGEEPSGDGDAQYDNARLGAISKIELIAGCRGDSANTIGSAYFDEIRFGTSWEDIVGATEPEDVWTAGITNGAYKGDFATWTITSKPHGPKQSAWVAISSNDTTFANSSVESNSTTWLDKVYDTDHWNSVWQGHELQFKGAGTWYGGGVVKGELVTVKSWERAVNAYKWNTYNVTNLPNPTKTNDVNRPPEVFAGDAKLGLAWAPRTLGGRTFPEVMIVRFPDGAAEWSPTDGTVYLKGGSAGAGTVVYRGTNATSLVDKGLNTNTTYRYQFYTVNNSYYSPGVSVSQTTTTNAPPIEINGDPNDWIGEPSEVKNSSKLSPNGEWIWTDKVGDGRKDINAAYDADITEFRMKVDATNVYFMARLNCLTNPANPYIAVGIATNVIATRLAETGNEDGENWLGDEANTFMGGNLFSPASLHYADIQMTVHQVDGTWQIELFKKGESSWYGPGGVGDVTWQVASSAAGAEDPCVEWKLKRSDLGLDFGHVSPARFTVASFVNSGGWNNQVVGTTKISDGTSYAVDTLAIAPWGVNDKDLSLTAWDEGIKNNNAEYWFDIWFGDRILHNAAPKNTDLSYPPNNATNIPASPTMEWTGHGDGPDSEESSYRGFVVGYLVEVSTNEYFNGLEGTMENGPISCRVNIPGATNTSYRYLTDSRYYWWRVRARDNSGTLSAPTVWHYAVQGKTDNEGPEPKLLYVGTNVMMFVTNEAYRTEQIISGDATSVLDSELEDGGHTFGFVIEWYDVNGVYATNHMHDQLGSPSSGGFAFNILAEHSDGIPYGRVSPNWDLVIVDRALTNGAVTPDPEKVGTNTYSWTFATNGLVLPTDDGGTETVTNWYIDCGLDKVFNNSETKNDGNFGQYLTNFVTGAFSIGNYRTSLDIYLTVSAEDGCETGEYGPTQWITPPVYSTNGSAGSYAPGPQPGANGSTLSSGWCADFPNPSRNVTTNRLLHIHVRDNDVIPPTSSTAKWGDDALDSNREKLLPSVVVSTGSPGSGAWDPTWARLGTNGLTRLPTHDGQGKTLQWHLTDADVVANGGTWKGSGNKLNFFFNVYDEYLHSGMQVATNHAAGLDYIKTITPTLKRTNWMDNTGMILGPSGSAWTNWAGYAIGISTNKRQGDSALHGEGTDPDTVLAWTYDAAETNLMALLGVADPLGAIGRDGEGHQLAVTNTLKLFAWDSDNNAAGDQEGAEISFGQLVFSDDDSTPPVSPGSSLLGSGTNHVEFGELAKWAGDNQTTMTNPAVMDGMVASALTSPETLNWIGDKYLQIQGGMTNTTVASATNGTKYFQFTLGSANGSRWTADTLVFDNRETATGPTNYILTVCEPAGLAAYPAETDGVVSNTWAMGGTTEFGKADGLYRFLMKGTNNATATLKSPTVNITATAVVAKVEFRVGAYKALGEDATLTVVQKWGTTESNLMTFTATDFVNGDGEYTTASGSGGLWLTCEHNLKLGGNVTVTWYASNLTAGAGFVLRDVRLLQQQSYGSETILSQATFPKDTDETGAALATTNHVTLTWAGEEIADGGTRQYRLYAWGSTASSTARWGINRLSMHGIVMSPKAFDVTDHDLRYGSWTNALEVIDGPMAGYDTAQSGLWVASNTAERCRAWLPEYALVYPEAFTNTGAAVEVTNGVYQFEGVTEAQYTKVGDGTFTNTVSSPWETANGADDHFEWNKARAGGRVLRLPSNEVAKASATQTTNLGYSAIGLANVSGATASGTLCLRAESTEEGHDNRVTVTLSLLDGSGGELGSASQTLTDVHMARWDEFTLEPLSVEGTTVRKARIAIEKTVAGGGEVYVDDVDIHIALWGAETTNITSAVSYNGVAGAKFHLKTAGMSSTNTYAPLSAEMAYSGSKQYTLESTVYDHDLDRENDACGMTVATAFSLYDDDEMAPQLGAQYAGPMEIRIGAGEPQARASLSASGTNVTWCVLDNDLERNASATLWMDIDGYDFSPWTTTNLSMTYTRNGASTTLFGGGSDILSGQVTNGVAGIPAATNTFKSLVSDWWGDANIQGEFALDRNAEHHDFTVWASLTDLDDDRANDSMATNSQIGRISFLDSDDKEPVFKNQQWWLRQVFIGTNSISNAYTAVTAKTNTSSGAWNYEVRVVTSNSTAADRVQKIYDGELTNGAFYAMANVGDPPRRVTGQLTSGMQRGATNSFGRTNAFNQAFTVTNTTLVFSNSVAGTNGTALGAIVMDCATNYDAKNSAGDTTVRGTTAVGPSTWSWASGMGRTQVGTLLPKGEGRMTYKVLVEAYDADTDRPGDQSHARLEGPTLYVWDDDTMPPDNPENIEVNGNPVGGTVTRETAAWTNNLTGWSLTFDEAVDGAPGVGDLASSGVDQANGYRMVTKVAGTAVEGTAWLDLTNVVSLTTADAGSGRRRAGLTTAQQAQVVQGLTTQLVFTVDRDDDRPYDALASSGREVPLAYDITPPPVIGTGSGKAFRLDAAESADDPTTQLDLKWPTKVGADAKVKLGPDDTSHTNHPTKKTTDYDYLSPWATYKIYYGTFDEMNVPELDDPFGGSGYIYTNFVANGAYLTNAFVTTNSTPSDTSGGAAPYASLGTVSNDTQSIRLYDLDFDQHYWVVIVGVDRAGNEGPAGLYSWATNNTIRFAVTQGVVKTTAKIDTMVTNSLADSQIKRPDLSTNAPNRGAVLYWKAAAQTNAAGVVTNVTKNYDLIYRDAASFDETDTEQWNMASSGTNSGTSKANWNYQADEWMSRPRKKLRFFRASYHDRWQTNNPTTGQKQTPLASEEVYSMNNVVLSEGYNYVSLQGVPYTNTFAAVFGTDTNMWPSGTGLNTEATRIEFFSPGTTAVVSEVFFFGNDGEWYNSSSNKVTYTNQTENFFTRPFGIVLPNANITTNDGVVTTNGWWKDHADYVGAKASESRSVKAMLWHPILQVPTNSPTAAGYSQTITASNNYFNLLSLNLPVAVHPSKLKLENAGLRKGNPWDADKLYVVDTETKEVRGGSMIYCTSSNTWKFVNGGDVPDGFILPNDMLVLISAANGTNWTWTYHPTNFYTLPDRHMGRKPE